MCRCTQNVSPCLTRATSGVQGYTGILVVALCYQPCSIVRYICQVFVRYSKQNAVDAGSRRWYH